MAPSSRFRVGCVATGASGRRYLGFNLEFRRFGHTLHAEQVALLQAFEAGESGLSGMVIERAPCGHCRQFLLEGFSETTELSFPGYRGPLDPLLPFAFVGEEFTPDGVGVFSRNRFGPGAPDLEPSAADPAALARWAARTSYAPYSGQLAAVAVVLSDGTPCVGRVVESAAYNPTVGPALSILAQLRAHQIPWRAIRSVFLSFDDGVMAWDEDTEQVMRDAGCPAPIERV